MRAPWNRNEHGDLERRLRASRPQPAEELVDAVMSRMQPGSRARRRSPRLALACVVAIGGLAVIGASGGVGYAASQAESVAHTLKNAVLDQPSSNDPTRGNQTGHASNHAYPNPGFYCVQKGSKDRIKLILTQRRYDRLVARGWSIGLGPFASHAAAKEACPDAGPDDGD
jgi:hypothetical protein